MSKQLNMKDVLIHLLTAVSLEFKRRCEQNTCEESRDKYGKWHGIVVEWIEELRNGSIK